MVLIDLAAEILASSDFIVYKMWIPKSTIIWENIMDHTQKRRIVSSVTVLMKTTFGNFSPA